MLIIYLALLTLVKDSLHVSWVYSETPENRTPENRKYQKTEQIVWSRKFCSLFYMYIDKTSEYWNLRISNTEQLFRSGNTKFYSILPLKTEHAWN